MADGATNGATNGVGAGAEPAGSLVDLLRYARRATPPGLRSALKPIVRRVIPERARRQSWEPDLTVCDKWVGNRHTIDDDGTTRRFFFLCGCYKSGTNWVQNLLNLHPKVDVVGEFHFDVLTRAVQHLTNTSWFLGNQPKLTDVAIDASEAMIRRMIYAGTRGKPTATWLGDRTPHAAVPIIRGAPQIYILRDVRDVLVSWSFHHLRLKDPSLVADQFKAKAAVVNPQFQSDPDSFNPLDGWLGDEAWLRFHARQWAEISRISRQSIPRLREDGTEVLEIRYEEIHADLDAHLPRLYRFLGLDPADAEQPSSKTKTLPGFERENRKSFFRKGTVGDWENYLDDRILRIIESEAGEEIVANGYALAAPPPPPPLIIKPPPQSPPVPQVEPELSSPAAPMINVPTHTPDGRPYKMFFISGHMRSGTTWMRNLMNLHPDINTQSEGPLKLLAKAVAEAKKATWLTSSRDEMPKILNQLFIRFGHDYTLALARYKPEAQWIGDHTSGHIQPIIPNCPHFSILRDGRDVLTSWTFHQLRIRFLIGEPFRSQMAALTEEFHKDPEYFDKNPHKLFSVEAWVRSAARGWSQIVMADLAMIKRIEAGEFPGTTVCPLRYERCITETAAEQTRMYEFLGLDPTKAASPSADTKTSAGFAKSNPMWFYRSGKVGDWKNYVTDDFKKWFKAEAGEALIATGYEQNLDW